MRAGSRIAAALRLGAVIFVVALAVPQARAAFPEPDVIYYGRVAIDGVQVGSLHDISAHPADPNRPGATLRLYRLGDDPALGGWYALRIPLEQPSEPGEARRPAFARVGDQVEIRLDGIAVQTVQLQARGEATLLDLFLTLGPPGGAVPGGSDTDGDGIEDAFDVCSRIPDPNQADSDGNGIGDACESLVSTATFAAIEAIDNPASATSGLGSVAYTYLLQQTEVTNAEYVGFLNAVALADAHGLFNPQMDGNPRGGISRSGTSGSFSYAVKPNMADKPVNFVSWFDAARYANWLENGGGGSTTETGSFDLSAGDPNQAPPLDPLADWSLPTEDEWHKAAYYDPTLARLDPANDYWRYPTQEDIEPIFAVAGVLGDIGNPGPSVANYGESAFWKGLSGHVTTVGSAQAPSFFGTQDQGGNVAEWTAWLDSASPPAVRGGAFDSSRLDLLESARSLRSALTENEDLGFRVVNLALLCGDLNGDGSTNVLDSVILERHLQKLPLATPPDLDRCNLIDDALDPVENTCNELDLAQLRLILADIGRPEAICLAITQLTLPTP